MKIRYSPDGAGGWLDCVEPDGKPSYVIVLGGQCPDCHGLTALIDARGKIAALAKTASIEEARASVLAEQDPNFRTHPPLTEQHCDGIFRVRCSVPAPIHKGAEGRTECIRCGRHNGVLRVEYQTIFGLEEDAAVLTHGRARVY